jgi:hypothetical protein
MNSKLRYEVRESFSMCHISNHSTIDGAWKKYMSMPRTASFQIFDRKTGEIIK